MPDTLVIDTGTDIVGVFSVTENSYVPYRGSTMRSEALVRILAADEVVTYNGEYRDLIDLAKIAGEDVITLKGVHTDMRIVCWSDRIWGSDLRTTFLRHYPNLPSFPDTYEGSNELDVYMTFKLWELWKLGKLRILDGHDQHLDEAG